MFKTIPLLATAPNLVTPVSRSSSAQPGMDASLGAVASLYTHVYQRTIECTVKVP